jgi:hypothetical protein
VQVDLSQTLKDLKQEKARLEAEVVNVGQAIASIENLKGINGFKTATDEGGVMVMGFASKKEAQEAVRQFTDNTSYTRTPEQRARIAEGVRRSWAAGRRKVRKS